MSATKQLRLLFSIDCLLAWTHCTSKAANQPDQTISTVHCLGSLLFRRLSWSSDNGLFESFAKDIRRSDFSTPKPSKTNIAARCPDLVNKYLSIQFIYPRRTWNENNHIRMISSYLFNWSTQQEQIKNHYTLNQSAFILLNHNFQY